VAGLLLGVDGGNTKTVALIARLDGTIVGFGRAGCADIYGAESPQAAVAAIAAAVENALAAAGAAPDDLDAAAFSLAGADWPEDFEYLREELGRRVPATRPPVVVNDAIGAVRAGAPGGVGVAVVCGTGGCVGARSEEGRIWHSSFWALHTGAWAIGNRALDAVYNAELGLGPATSLTARALEVFAEPSVEEVLHAFTRRGGRGPFEAAEFAPAVIDEAEVGDSVARSIVGAQGAVLGDIVRVAAARVGLAPPFPLVLAGGVLRHPSRLLADAVVARVPGGRPLASAFEPVVGSLLLAADAVGATLDEERLRATFPPTTLFAT
jgi:N-acetylglucosamine kinase-like BadF-type ATPase